MIITVTTFSIAFTIYFFDFTNCFIPNAKKVMVQFIKLDHYFIQTALHFAGHIAITLSCFYRSFRISLTICPNSGKMSFSMANLTAPDDPGMANTAVFIDTPAIALLRIAAEPISSR